MQTEARPRFTNRAGAMREGEGGGSGRGKAAIELYTTLEPPTGLLKSRSSGKSLGRSHRLGR
jgi:hypothetical protein